VWVVACLKDEVRLAIETESWAKQLLGVPTRQQAEALGGAASLNLALRLWSQRPLELGLCDSRPRPDSGRVGP